MRSRRHYMRHECRRFRPTATVLSEIQHGLFITRDDRSFLGSGRLMQAAAVERISGVMSTTPTRLSEWTFDLGSTAPFNLPRGSIRGFFVALIWDTSHA